MALDGGCVVVCAFYLLWWESTIPFSLHFFIVVSNYYVCISFNPMFLKLKVVSLDIGYLWDYETLPHTNYFCTLKLYLCSLVTQCATLVSGWWSITMNVWERRSLIQRVEVGSILCGSLLVKACIKCTAFHFRD